MNYVTVASTFSGNKGAASMLEASIQTISAVDKDAHFTVFTVYPEEDKRFNTYNNVSILPAKPLYLGAVINPLTFLYKILPPLRSLLRKQRHIKALANASVLLDQGGITFVDGRAKFLLYNAATILPGFFTNTPVIKCSQAMGPFDTMLNKLFAKLLLPYVATICARGDITYNHLLGLGLTNLIQSTDYAFLMGISKQQAAQSDKILNDSGFIFGDKAKTVAVLPSEVVRKKAESNGQDYVGYNTFFIRQLIDQGYHVLLMAYSAREGKQQRHNNDLIICRSIAKGIQNKNFTFLDHELSAQQLRHIIGKMDMIVTSRFHAMIAALAMNVPPLIIGWSHKYEEIMDMFDLKEAALDSKKLDQEALLTAFKHLTQTLPEARAAIKKHIVDVKKNAYQQVDTIVGQS